VGSVIRREMFASTPRLSFEDLEQRARQVLEAARRQAAAILRNAEQQARQRAEQRYREAYEQGRREGRQAGFEEARREAAEQAKQQAREQLDRLQATLRQALEGFDTAKRRLLAQAERGVVRLAVAVAQRVCKRVALQSGDAALANAQHLLAMARHEHDLVLRVHPADAEALRAHLPDLMQQIEQAQHVSVEEDESVPRGGCVLAAREGTLDATIETQIDRLALALTGEPLDNSTDVGRGEPAV